jgi:glycosyltransferase involved in cell wall biosynthesis
MKLINKKTKIAFSWNELPAYGAKLLKAGIEKINSDVTIVATIPKVPIKGMEEILGQNVNWIGQDGIFSWKQIGLKVPDIFFQAGTYYVSSFKNLGDEVRESGGKVVLLSDNSWKKSFRQIGGAFLFRLIFKKRFSCVWVPGESGEKLMSLFGFSKKQIYKGLYGSDDNSFKPGLSLEKRSKQFIFVGQLISRKGIRTLIKAFKIFNINHPDWKISVFGDGKYRYLLENCPGVSLHSFAQPLAVANAMQQSRFIVLPSLVDHWPLVVSEASLSGCGMILSNQVGNNTEFLNKKNGFIFPAKSVKDLSECLSKAALMSDQRLKEIYHESLRLGMLFTPKQWGNKFFNILSDLDS